MPIGFGWWDSAGNYHYGAQVQADSSGDLIVIPGTGAGTASMLLFGNLTTNSVILSPNGTGTGLSSYPLFFQYGSSSAPSTTSIVADLNGTLHMPSSLFYAGANFAGATYLSPNGTGTGLNSYPLAFQYGSSSSPSAVSIYAGYDGALRIPASIISGLTVNGTENISALAGANANSNYLTFQSTLASATQVFQIYTDYANNYLHMGGSVSAVSYLAGTNLILPSTLTGFHGTGAGDVMVQFSDGSGSSGYAAVYDAYGGLTNGGGAPALLSGATFTGPVGIYGIFSNALFSTYGTSTLSGTSITGYAAVYTANSYQASSVYGFLSFPTTAAGISVANVNGYSSRFSIGAGGSVGSYSGFHDAEAYLHLATNNAAFSDNTSYTGNYFIHQLYSDPSVFGGQVTVTGPIQINPIGTATSVSGNYSSYNFQELGSYWNGTAAAGDTWFINNVLGTGTAPTSTLTIQHTGSSGLATVSVPSLTAGAGFAVAASGATSVTASGVSVVPLTLYGHNVSQTADLLDVYNYSGGSIVAAISPTGGLAGSSLVITGCGAGYYAKADGAGCGIPAGTYSLPTATSSTLGGVKPDGSTITNTSGAISVNYGTTSGTAAQGNDSRITGAAQCTAGTASGNCITNSMTGLGDLLYGGASGASTKLTGFTGGDGQLVVLTETTSGGGAAQAPAWVLPSTMTVGYAGTSTNVDGATNCILYNSSTNITGCISGVNNAVVVTNSSGTPSEVTTLPAANLPAATPTVAGVVVKVANTTFTTSTSSVAANTCNSTVQVAMTGVTTSMTFGITPSADTSAAAGWGSTGGLVLDTWPTAGYLNYKICNQTTAAISTPGAVTFNVSAQ